MDKSKKIDLLVLFLFVIITVFIVTLYHVRFLTSSFLFFCIPSIYLIIRKTQNLKSIFPGVLLIGIILGFLFDFLATLNRAWFIPQNQLIFPYRVFGAAPLDELITLVFLSFLILLVYEHFFERKRKEKLQLKHYFWSGILPACVSFIIIIAAFSTRSQLIVFPYAYAVLGILAIAPLFFLAIKKPSILKRILCGLPYFIFLFLSFELTALHLGQWVFPGQYIGQVTIFSFKFPLEELLIWIIANSCIALADYKLFVDVGE